MPLLKIEKLTEGLAGDWPGHLRDWDRTLRAANHPETTRYNYLLAAAQLGRYLGEHSPDPDAEDAAEDPTDVTKAHVEHFQAWVIETRSAATALNKHKGLQQFFKYLVDEDEMDRSPMDRVKQPKTPKKLIPVMRDDDTKKLLDACKGKSFVNLRDEALIRLYYNTGARLSEVGNLLLTDLDLNTESVRFHGKGAKDRRVRFGPKTARALSRYLRHRRNVFNQSDPQPLPNDHRIRTDANQHLRCGDRAARQWVDGRVGVARPRWHGAPVVEPGCRPVGRRTVVYDVAVAGAVASARSRHR
ncbi:phage integrase N-terminal SAM-like domain-containing protein [Dactylosporangium sp. AC04546]|uniref:tyrosine-type recombinase/integrase n=1 Tax=Dactylosporangium sp. AC04546 TaxID=2862460 RepID=UPI001EDF68B1|nr:tyrosine-type recombinase/integrase [Dactylosporangium sp. AC04546]WVK86408.1 phage integrase N-terminal SAM-like domain-containing protein [Dactylosporangium sp. AC04546]